MYFFPEVTKHLVAEQGWALFWGRISEWAQQGPYPSFGGCSSRWSPGQDGTARPPQTSLPRDAVRNDNSAYPTSPVERTSLSWSGSLQGQCLYR